MAPLTSVEKKERVEWAKERVIEAARHVTLHAHDDSYKAALRSRLDELDSLLHAFGMHAA